MSEPLQIRARRLRLDLWVYVRADEDLPSPRLVADGIVEGLGDAWFDLHEGDSHAASAVWQAEYIGDEDILTEPDT